MSRLSAWLRRRRPSARKILFGQIKAGDRVLEIGPFTSPNIRGPKVKYFDVLDKASLLERAVKHDYPRRKPVDIDFVSPNGDLSIVGEAFDFVASSHCIEHQPDLVYHLQQVGRLLRNGGRYLLVVPDKRYCFDHFFPESTLDAVLAAHAERRTRHTLENVIAHQLHQTHNDAARHWSGDHGALPVVDQSAIDRVKSEHDSGKYIDVHAWQFTPKSFEDIFAALYDKGLSPLACRKVDPTLQNTFEFCAVLEKPR